MGFFDRLMDRTATIRHDFANQPKVLNIQSIGMSVDKYQRLLTQLYHVVLNFCPIMSIAAGNIGEDRRHLRFALWHEIEEERGHEEWVAQDYVAVGGDAAALRRSRPAMPVDALIGFNYSIAYRSPAGVLGMRFAQELIARDFAGDAVEAIAAAIGREPSEDDGFRFLMSHAVMDATHVDELAALLGHPLSAADEDAIVRTAGINYHLFSQLVED